MKRLLVLLAVVFPMCWFSAGCGSGGPTGAAPPKKPPEDMAKMMMESKQRAMQKGGAPQTPAPADAEKTAK